MGNSKEKIFVEYIEKIYELIEKIDENDDVFQLLEQAEEKLFDKVGFDKAIYDFYINTSLRNYVEDKDFKGLYDVLAKENVFAIEARKILEDIEKL